MSATATEQPKTEIVDMHIKDFSRSLAMARSIWKRYPELVESRDFPEPFKPAFRIDEDQDAYDDVMGEEELVAAGLLKPQLGKS